MPQNLITFLTTGLMKNLPTYLIAGLIIGAMIWVVVVKIIKSSRGEGGCSGCSGCPSANRKDCCK